MPTTPATVDDIRSAVRDNLDGLASELGRIGGKIKSATDAAETAAADNPLFRANIELKGSYVSQTSARALIESFKATLEMTLSEGSERLRQAEAEASRDEAFAEIEKRAAAAESEAAGRAADAAAEEARALAEAAAARRKAGAERHAADAKTDTERRIAALRAEAERAGAEAAEASAIADADAREAAARAARQAMADKVLAERAAAERTERAERTARQRRFEAELLKAQRTAIEDTLAVLDKVTESLRKSTAATEEIRTMKEHIEREIKEENGGGVLNTQDPGGSPGGDTTLGGGSPGVVSATVDPGTAASAPTTISATASDAAGRPLPSSDTP